MTTTLSSLKNLTGAVRHQKGTVVADPGSPPSLHIVLLGEIGEFLQYGKLGQKGLSTYGRGEFFGEWGLSGEPLPVTAVALTDAITLPIARDALPAFLQNEPACGAELIRALCERTAALGGAYAKLAGHHFHLGAVPHDPVHGPTPAAATKVAASTAKPVASAPPPAGPSIPVGELFPEGHGSYTLPINTGDRFYLMEKGYDCPICKHGFRALKVRSSRLIPEGSDPDLRTRYKGVEPLYYDIATCPNCLYSAPDDLFAKPDNPKAEGPSALTSLKAAGKLHFELERDTTSIFAGYYLALLCAPAFFPRHPLTIPNLLLKLYRLYQDAGDEKMAEQLAKLTLDAHLQVYQSTTLTTSQEQQIQLLLAELSLRLGDLRGARQFFFKVKSDRSCPATLKTHAEDRIAAIRAGNVLPDDDEAES